MKVLTFRGDFSGVSLVLDVGIDQETLVGLSLMPELSRMLDRPLSFGVKPGFVKTLFSEPNGNGLTLALFNIGGLS